MQTISRALGVFVVVLLTSLSGAAFAQDIVKLNEEGISAFSEGRFEEAAQKFSQAYAIKPEPPLKKNEALAWFKADKCTEALGAAKEYLALGVDDELSTREARTVAVRCYIKQAQTEIAAGNLDQTTATLADARTYSPMPEDEQILAALEGQVQAQRDAAEADRQAAIAQAEARRAQEAEQQRRDRAKTLGLGVAAGGGAIVLGTLIYHIALATGTASKFKDAAANGDRAQYDKLGKRLETGNWLVPTLYAVGLAAGGVGGYLWWSASAHETAPPQTARILGLDTVGFTASWRF